MIPSYLKDLAVTSEYGPFLVPMLNFVQVRVWVHTEMLMYISVNNIIYNNMI